MTKAIITGHSSGIGLEITKTLLDRGFLVYGISRSSVKEELTGNFTEKQCDITDLQQLEKTAQEILNESQIDLVINCAGIGLFAMHEDLRPKDLANLVQTNLTAPIIISNLFLKTLKKTEGTLINITSISGKQNSKFGAAYGATKAGLESFGKSLFDEARKSGVQVINIAPDLTDTHFYDNLSFRPSKKIGSSVFPKQVANAVEFILAQPKGTVITEMTLRPQKILIDKT